MKRCAPANCYEAGVKSTFVDQVSVLYYIPLVNKAFWDKLSARTTEAAFKAAWERARSMESALRRLRRQQAAAEENAKNGVEIFQPNPDELAKVNEMLLGLVPDIAKQVNVDPATIELAQQELKKLN
jgi:TRAP-type C4-dicarboxylate transport system substrate-binding protein